MVKPQVDTDALLAWLGHTFSDSQGLHSLTEGEDSRAFAIQTHDGALVVRVNEGAAGFAKDTLAFEQFGAPDLPIPEVLLITPWRQEWLCVSRRARGETLQDMPVSEAHAHGAALGRVMDTMANRTFSPDAKAGPMDRNGLGGFNTWPDFIGDIVNWSWKGLDRQARNEVAIMVRAVLDKVPDLPDKRQLVHGDFGSNNVLADQGTITGIIDWSEAMIGDADYDLANLMFWRPWLDCMEQQCRYFGQHEPERFSNNQRLSCYQLHIGLEVLHDALDQGDMAMVDWSLRRCRTILPEA